MAYLVIAFFQGLLEFLGGTTQGFKVDEDFVLGWGDLGTWVVLVLVLVFVFLLLLVVVLSFVARFMLLVICILFC